MDTKHTQHSADSDHEISVLPKEMWRDDGNPVADTAKKYERAIRSINRAMEPLPIHTRLLSYVAGAVVGMLPGAAFHAFTKNNPSMTPHMQEMATHVLITAGVITGMHMADKLMEEPHVMRQTQETSDFLKGARQQARDSYAAYTQVKFPEEKMPSNNIVPFERIQEGKIAQESELAEAR